jgi:hypothetical protein
MTDNKAEFTLVTLFMIPTLLSYYLPWIVCCQDNQVNNVLQIREFMRKQHV